MILFPRDIDLREMLWGAWAFGFACGMFVAAAIVALCFKVTRPPE